MHSQYDMCSPSGGKQRRIRKKASRGDVKSARPTQALSFELQSSESFLHNKEALPAQRPQGCLHVICSRSGLAQQNGRTEGMLN
jgi:hypothetical protein